MRFVTHTDIVSVKQFALGLIHFEFANFSGGFVMFMHLLLVAILLIIFPFSKLLHAPGLFFSPSRNQVDNPRERRHVSRAASVKAAAPESGESASGE